MTDIRKRLAPICGMFGAEAKQRQAERVRTWRRRSVKMGDASVKAFLHPKPKPTDKHWRVFEGETIIKGAAIRT